MPSQILSLPDGRLAVSFQHTGPDAAPLVIRARRLRGLPAGTARPPAAAASPAETPKTAPTVSIAVPSREDRLQERAHQDRTIVYFLRPPESHAFDLYHDYTESRPGVDRYLNVVRKGSAASAPAARNLDTGEALVFDRTFGRPRNAVVLPAGWYLTASAVPALVSPTPDGRIRLDFVNPRNDDIAVLIEARRRPDRAR